MKVKSIRIPEEIDLFGEMGIKGNISAKDVMNGLKARTGED